MLQRALESATRLVEAQAGSLWLCNERTGGLVIEAAVGEDGAWLKTEI